MTKEEEIRAIEIDIRNIFKRTSIPTILVYKANSLLDRWKTLTGWEERTESPLQGVSTIKTETPVIDKTPYYQFDETRRH